MEHRFIVVVRGHVIFGEKDSAVGIAEFADGEQAVALQFGCNVAFKGWKRCLFVWQMGSFIGLHGGAIRICNDSGDNGWSFVGYIGIKGEEMVGGARVGDEGGRTKKT